MRVLSLKQPWAQLICLGLKDVEGRTWTTPYRGKILIHASSTKPSKNFMNKLYDEDACEVDNEMKFGNLADPKTLPTSSIIGYVTLRDIVEESDSIWAYPNILNWELEDAYIFDEPIAGINGKLNLWNYDDLDENNLPPAHKAELRRLELDGSQLIIPLTEEWLDQSLSDGWLTLEWSEGLNNLIFDEEQGQELTISSVKLVSPTRTAIVEEVETFNCNQTYEDGSQVYVTTKLGESIEYTNFLIEFKSQPIIS